MNSIGVKHEEDKGVQESLENLHYGENYTGQLCVERKEDKVWGTGKPREFAIW